MLGYGMTLEEINTKLDTLLKEVENWKPQKVNDSHQKPIKEKGTPNV